MKIEDIYTPIENVKEILEERWNNIELKKEVLEFLGDDLPSFILKEPHAFICRNLASPDNEFDLFLNLSSNLKLKPACLEYTEDKFVAQNDDKYCFAKMAFDFGLGKKGGRKLEYLNIIDFNTSNGKRICDLNTTWGENLVVFHHDLFNKVYKNHNIIIYDFSSWIKMNGKYASKYYKKYLTFFVCFGVLFENFFSEGNESQFTMNVIEILQNIKSEFGFYPVITKLVQDGSEQDDYWYSYKNFIKKNIDDRIGI